VGCHSPLTNCRHHKHSHWHRRYTTISIRNEAPQMPHRMHPPHNHYCGLCSKLSKTPKEPAKDCTGPPYLNTFTISSPSDNYTANDQNQPHQDDDIIQVCNATNNYNHNRKTQAVACTTIETTPKHGTARMQRNLLELMSSTGHPCSNKISHHQPDHLAPIQADRLRSIQTHPNHPHRH